MKCAYLCETKPLKTIIMTNLNNYTEQLESVALFAKRINYNIDNGVEKLMQLWIADCKQTWNYIDDNKTEIIRQVKKSIKLITHAG